MTDREPAEDRPIVSHAAFGLTLWGALVGVGYTVDAGDAAGAYHLSGLFRIAMWTLFLVGGWTFSLLDARWTSERRFGLDHPTRMASAVSLPGGLFFTLYFALGLGFGSFDDYVMWMVTVASFGSWAYGVGVVSRRKWLCGVGLGWFALFAAGIFLRDRVAVMDLLMALGCFGLLAVPGLRLRREERVLLAAEIAPTQGVG